MWPKKKHQKTRNSISSISLGPLSASPGLLALLMSFPCVPSLFGSMLLRTIALIIAKIDFAIVMSQVQY